jgi:hypothetical protein
MKEDQSETTEKKKPESQKYKKRGDEYVWSIGDRAMCHVANHYISQVHICILVAYFACRQEFVLYLLNKQGSVDEGSYVRSYVACSIYAKSNQLSAPGCTRVFHLPLNLHAPHKEGENKRKIKVNMNLPLNASYIIRKYM